ncbi:gibberellin 20 oxidase 1-like [Amborella trichopoda]|uniref:gibberellin 20 oxidase 1-like n=1 Tax=Amborella trichopoda TaxID=13333 RepID=UPI0009BDF0FB|nr:gibberellin 20 oxidase 1-like [Amborella trichopoda]|eukprot:XP_020519352.1 gibberellin 20 oxidase 1-like [Amborella trichopoda]
MHKSLYVKDFMWSENEWPKIRHDDYESGDNMPLISLLEILDGKRESEAYENLCKDMVMACESWGFFKLVDHGIPNVVIESMKERCLGLFDLPMEQKLKGERSSNLPLGYSPTNTDYGHNLPWAESLQLLQSPQQVLTFSKKVFGNEHSPFSDAMLDYMHAMDALGMLIFEMLAHGLGLPHDYFSKNFEEKEATMIRINRYPPCPLPSKCLGLGSHSDPHTLTILLQDEVGGLQVLKKDEEWVGIRPLPNSFIINVGDTLEAWSNGRLKSVVHRAVVNKEKQRFSIAYFLSPASDMVVDSPSQLIDQEKTLKDTFLLHGHNSEES